MIYNISDIPKFKETLVYACQMLLSVFVATVLIANICGTPIDACLFGAFVGTLTYEIITKFKSPMFISSCGATVSAVIGALAIGETKNYLAVFVGGFFIFLVYALFSWIIKTKGIAAINKVFPPIIVGPVTMVIGLNLATFILTYTQVQGEHSDIGIIIAIITMLTVAIASHYFKGFASTIPFLIGLLVGYAVSLIVTLCGIAPLVDLSGFHNMKIFTFPDFAFMHWSECEMNIGVVIQVAILFIPVAICALLEHYSDHKVLSNIIGTDLTEEPGLHRTLLGDGCASMLGTIICGLPNTSYGESIATMGFSKVACTHVTCMAATLLGLLAFEMPLQVFINSIPACVFGGCAMVLYGFIASSGLKTLINSKVDLENNKNLLVTCVILTTGVSGIYFLHASFSGVSLAMVLGVILNLILKDKSVD